MATSTPRSDASDPGRLVRWELASHRASRAVLSGAWAVHAGLWLGLLGDEALDTATEAYYRTSPRWLDERLTREGLATWEADAVDRWFPSSGRILVPAAGAGREVLPLVAMGYDVAGFDPSAPLIELGNHLLTATWAKGSLLHAPPGAVPEDLEGPFDAVLFGWGGISHVRGRTARVDLLSAIRDLCRDGAPMLISFLSREPHSRRFRTTRSVASAIRRLRRDPSPIELGDAVDGSFDHYFTFDEMAAELADAGFTETARVRSPYAHIVATAT